MSNYEHEQSYSDNPLEEHVKLAMSIFKDDHKVVERVMSYTEYQAEEILEMVRKIKSYRTLEH